MTQPVRLVRGIESHAVATGIACCHGLRIETVWRAQILFAIRRRRDHRRCRHIERRRRQTGDLRITRWHRSRGIRTREQQCGERHRCGHRKTAAPAQGMYALGNRRRRGIGFFIQSLGDGARKILAQRQGRAAHRLADEMPALPQRHQLTIMLGALEQKTRAIAIQFVVDQSRQLFTDFRVRHDALPLRSFLPTSPINGRSF